MATHTTPHVTALQAQAVANLFLSDHVPDRLTADQPQFDAGVNLWHVPVVLAYPGIGAVGCVGVVCVSATTATIVSHTPLAEMHQTAQALYDANRDAIDAAFS
jgi:hypothetical protein